jgi:hypothetical protein
VRVSEHAAAEELEMLAQLRLGVETAPRVIEVHVPADVQSTELSAAQLIEDRGRRIARIGEERHVIRRLTWMRPAVGRAHRSM